MKLLHLCASVLLFVVTAFMAVSQPLAALSLLCVGSAILLPWQATSLVCEVTLTPTILLQRTMRALFVKCPALQFFAHEFTTERLKFDQDVIGKIRTRPVTSTYDANNGGYKNGSQSTRDLLIDVNFKMDQHLHVTYDLAHLDALRDSIIDLEGVFVDSASVLGASVGRYMLGKISSASFSNGSTFTTGNSNKDALIAMRSAMNLRGVPDERFGLVNSLVMDALDGDARITNRYDNNSQSTDGEAYRRLRNLAGFREVLEDPALGNGNSTPINCTAEADDDTVTTSDPHGYVVNDRVNFPALTGGTGLTASTGYYYVKEVPSPTTFKVSATRGGAVLNITVDATAGTVRRADNISGFFGTREAIAIKTGLPTDSLDAAKAFNIPVPVSAEVVTDPDTGLSMIAYKWFEVGTMKAYVTLAVIFGATAGALADTTHKVMEPSGHILRTA